MTTIFFTSIQIGWFNAWIPSFAMVAIQFIYMALFKEGGKRAVDTSWYTPTDKRNAAVSTILQISLLLLSIFIPLKRGTTWFWVGAAIYMIAFFLFVSAFHDYISAPTDKLISKGIYRISRNPMYLFYFIGTLGICIASASLWMLLLLIPFIIFTHLTILGEERYCTQTYGEEYKEYLKKVRRYL